ncbi:uncharacterized protein LOC100197493 isoform X2 [Hydra vulgaris]|uniref:Uncharacterized protein LOC100197493 isoform X2 n=1 Tax=Hydra vulgaris TaxID=6087 RepID=A0ABM4C0U1_HYDVU
MTSSLSFLIHNLPGLLAALFYAFVSGSMSFMNKVILTSYHYDYPDVIMLFQVVLTAIVVDLCRMTNICKIPPWTFQRSREFFFPSLCFALHTTLALAALSGLSIPIYNVLRRMLPLATLLTAHFVLKKTPSYGIITSVLIIVIGTVLAGLGDLKFHFSSYCNGLLSVVAQATYLTYVQKTGVEDNTSALSVLHINSINCIPMMLIYTTINGKLLESFSFTGFKNENDRISFIVAFVANISMGCVLNYSLFLCATLNSALTTSLIGVIKGVLTTLVGFLTFGGQPITFMVVAGITLNAIGGVLYTVLKYFEKRKQSSKVHTTHDHQAA